MVNLTWFAASSFKSLALDVNYRLIEAGVVIFCPIALDFRIGGILKGLSQIIYCVTSAFRHPKAIGS
ncbi:MAG TPA: hypothetical protein VK141_09825 [Nitrosomonas sp.]|nr:hypothetical protein [Nitrosomonas sp.]